MEKSKIVKISGVVAGLILLIVGFSFISTGSSLQGRLSRDPDPKDFEIENNLPNIGINNELEEFQHTLINETEYLNSECSQLKYKLYQLNKDYEKLDNEFTKVHGEREQEYYKAEQLKADWDESKTEYLVYKADFDKYMAEYNKGKAELEKIAKEYGVTIEVLLEKYKALPEKDTIFAHWNSMTLASLGGTSLTNSTGNPISKKLNALDAEIKAMQKKYNAYTKQLTDLQEEMGKKGAEISLLEEAIEIKCGTPKSSSRGEKYKFVPGSRGGKNNEQEADERWSQGIDSQSREIEELTFPEIMDFEIGEGRDTSKVR